ncbi:DEP domain-containing protein 5-like protein [Leptotrombidium deliense]|uniref:DEP domain-containing protein 5-like protein n=1 Tax=Leptotrombidium deliense TaxID=299467 RepID=A0A443SNY9_9ACAR|nr:DEP domain-containing protein 5-like protein [Leptotrombidium deliense]
MKTFKLNIHQKNFSQEEVLISEKDYPAIKLGDVIEIYTPEDEFSRLLLQITYFAEEKDFQQKDKPTISIEQSIATNFQLRTYCDVIVNVVNPKDVSLDSVEMFFKDQYLSRSDMWRLKKHLSNTCVYLNKKIEINGIRCGVFEMWSQGERVASGYVNDETKIVYRSSSSMVYLFLQMSSEMWDFDINGDLYFEKAVDGFLANLFEKWKRCNCNHDVTIVLFSRTFYDANKIEAFPEFMRPCLQQDHKGRYYEDFYRVAVQNERLDDWSSTLILLKKLFNEYEKEVLKYHEKENVHIPRAFNSTSSQGNFLEVLNIALNVFEKHYLDRSFDRTGQLSVVISPGVGVFEVDFDLTNITKQRIIDNGIGSDLVCLGEQPLHAVPLFKFNGKQSVPREDDGPDAYNMPHWINLSFYSSSKQTNFSNFVPRIKMPNILLTVEDTKRKQALLRSPSRENNTKNCRNMLPFVNFDEYDSMVFKSPSHMTNTTYTCQPSSRRRVSATSPTNKRDAISRMNSRRISDAFTEKYTEDIVTIDYGSRNAKSENMSIPSVNSSLVIAPSALSTSIESKGSKEIRTKIESQDDLILRGHNGIQNSTMLLSRPKALINPFDPSHLTIKLTSNRRRWTHVFPLGPTGIFMQQHHYQAVPQNTACTLLPSEVCVNPALSRASFCDISDQVNYKKGVSVSHVKYADVSFQNYDRKLSPKAQGVISHNVEQFRPKSTNHRTTSSILTADPHTDKSLTWVWGATGEQEWTPAITTGVDWKSLVKPACLPITTDFFPDVISLQNDFVLSDYTLSLEDQDLFHRKYYGGEEDNRRISALDIEEVFHELICQRLQQGFQIILDPKSSLIQSQISQSNVPFEPKHANKLKRTLSIGRIFHILELESSEVKVTQYRPRHPYQTCNIRYCYRFQAPDNGTYTVSWVDFSSERLENYNWSYLDSYICLRGEGEYKLMESLKFWRFRLLLLPAMLQSTKKIIESLNLNEKSCSQFLRCDIYSALKKSDSVSLEDGFLKFMEVINKIRRPPTCCKKWSKAEFLKNHDTLHRRNSFTQSCSVQKTENSFRDRIGSSIDHDRLKNKVQSKMNEKQKDDNMLSHLIKFQSDIQSKSPSETSMTEFKKLSINNSKKEIIDGMKTSSFYFLNKQGGLPPHTFIGTEAVIWAIANIDGVYSEKQAVNLFQDVLEDGLICHASGDKKQSFKYGFYLYYICDKTREKSEKNSQYFYCDLETFRKEWFEVELISKNNYLNEIDCDVEETDIISGKTTEFNYNDAILEFEVSSRCDRPEWVHVKYSSVYDPRQAFELTLEWMVATGNQIADAVQTWARKASPALHLVPIPSDPFALPFSGKSDPLRGPIFVPLNLQTLPSLALSYFSDDRILRFQEKILTAFGFVPFYDISHEGQRQYVHVSGSIFVLIPNRKLSQSTPTQAEQVCCSSHEEYITRHFSGCKQKENGADNKIGFLWSWNYMITKRWKTPATGDETFQRRVLKDFRLFCANEDNRLCSFWDTYQSKTYDENEPIHFSDS